MSSNAITHNHAQLACKQLGLKFDSHIGSGAFKQVFRTSDRNGRLVALKLSEGSHVSPRSVRETEVLKACNHPSIAQLIDSGELAVDASRKLYYSLEEYLGGGTLASKMTLRTLDAPTTRQIGRDLIDALAHIDATERRCVHRDIKPENIMFRHKDARPVLVDFGLARVLTDVSLTQSWLAAGPGTPYYASPEQLNNQKAMIDWRSDQFSLGVTLSVASLGMHPYQHPADQPFSGAVVKRVATREPQSPSFLTAATTRGLEILILMTCPWPMQRVRFHADLLTKFR